MLLTFSLSTTSNTGYLSSFLALYYASQGQSDHAVHAYQWFCMDQWVLPIYPTYQRFRVLNHIS